MTLWSRFATRLLGEDTFAAAWAEGKAMSWSRPPPTPGSTWVGLKRSARPNVSQTLLFESRVTPRPKAKCVRLPGCLPSRVQVKNEKVIERSSIETHELRKCVLSNFR